jgi:aspartyl-tRNA(Asn)/glutamyl-tRNA(Gln) amidotransferase subunit A
MDPRDLNITDLHNAYADGSLSVEAVTSAYIDAIDLKDSKIKAYLEVFNTSAIKRAEELDTKLRVGEKPSGLFGVPIAVKDNMCVRGTRTTAGSKILEKYIAPYTATAVQKLIDAGAVILGKTNMDEFAMGASTEYSAYQKTTNPWDSTRVPGGSSGGSAAAVAAQEALVSLGSDTGGSVRQPASFCGVVGLKSTYGRVSRNGLIAMTSSLDQIGPLARNVADVARVFSIIAGPDQKDSTTVNAPEINISILKRGLKGLRIGVLQDFLTDGMHDEVTARVKEAVDLMEKSGAKIIPVDLPIARASLAVYYLIVTSEVSSNLARYDGIRYGGHPLTEPAKTFAQATAAVRTADFGEEVQRRILLGTFTLSKGYADRYYHKARNVQQIIAKEFIKTFHKVDVLFGPTAPTPAFKLGEKFDDPLTMYLSDIFTVPANIANLPAISLPIGFANRLPVGGQFMAPSFREDLVFQAAMGLEQECAFADLAARK